MVQTVFHQEGKEECQGKEDKDIWEDKEGKEIWEVWVDKEDSEIMGDMVIKVDLAIKVIITHINKTISKQILIKALPLSNQALNIISLEV